MNVWNVLKTGGILWLLFAVAFVSTVCIYPVFSVGLKEYIRQYSFIYQIFPWIRKKWNQFTDEVNHIDFSDKTTKTILKNCGDQFSCFSSVDVHVDVWNRWSCHLLACAFYLMKSITTESKKIMMS